MGIKKLLTILDVIQKGHLEDYRGKTVGIDGYSWIHKAIYNSGHEIVVQKDTSSYMAKVAAKFELLKQYGIKIVIVFDGDKLPSKNNTENEREEKRNEKRDRAKTLLQEGNIIEANKRFSESIDVTPQLAYETLEYLKKHLYSFECSCG